MAVSTRLVRRRIKSITNTRKITKAMELVSAAKMRKAISAVLGTRPYANSAWRAVEEVAKVTDPSAHRLLQRNDGVSKALVIVFSSDRGLCGGINSRLLKTVYEFVSKSRRELEFVVIGRKGQQALKRRRLNIVASFSDLTHNPRLTEVMPIAKLAMDDYGLSKYESVWLAFTDYRSSIAQDPVVRQLLPIGRIAGLGEVDSVIAGVQKPGRSAAETARLGSGAYQYEFEPSPEIVLEAMLPRLVETQVYQALLESLASEHSARMMTMRAASDSADDMISQLTLTLNQARQAGITMEIAEISSGKAALEKSS